MTLRVNIRSRVCNAAIRRETRDGREVIIVPSATLPDDVVMNRVKYPGSVIAKSYKTLEGTPAPLGHPKANGKFVPALSAEGINRGWIGAHNENVRRENGRVFVDKVVDVEVAMRHPQGADLIAAIDKGEPIHTSTGVLLNAKDVQAEDYDREVTGMVLDHDCFLLGEQGAATPEQGVGVHVNSDGSEVDAMTVDLPEDFIEAVAREIVYLEDRQQREQQTKSLMDALREFLSSRFTGGKTEAEGLTANHDEGNTMPISEKDFADLREEVRQLATNSNADSITKALTPLLEPITNKLGDMEKRMNAAQDAEKQGYVEQIVNAGLLPEDAAKGLDVNAAKALAARCKPEGKAAGILGGFAGNDGDQVDPFEGYDMNANIDDKGAEGK